MTTPVSLSATGVLTVAGLAVVGLAAWKLSKVGSALASGAADVVTHELNPASSDNLVNRSVEAVGRAVTGDGSWTLGGAIYDRSHTDPADPTRFTGFDDYRAWVRRFWGLEEQAGASTSASSSARDLPTPSIVDSTGHSFTEASTNLFFDQPAYGQQPGYGP